MEEIKERLRLGKAFSFDRLGHEGSGGGGDGTARPFKLKIYDRAILDEKLEAHPIPAEGIVTPGTMGGAGKGSVVAGVPVMIEDEIEVELGIYRHCNYFPFSHCNRR
jgi:hypothetical protein